MVNFDIGEFLKLSVPAAIFLVPVIMALVTVLGDTFPAIKGRWQLLSALVIGLLLGGGLFWVLTEPATPAGWFASGMFGLICGLTASGKYNTDKESSAKGAEIASEKATAEWVAEIGLDESDESVVDDRPQ